MGLWPISLRDIARSMGLVMTLFAGPIFESLVVEESWREYAAEPGLILTQLFEPIGMRNYIAGPFTEELLFRSLIIPLNIISPQVRQASTGLAGNHARLVLFTTPLYFGIAHIHHLYESRITRPYVPFKFALLQALFQLGFTTVFGWYASFIFLRTGSLWACVLTHSFCNWMGLPRFFGRVERREKSLLEQWSSSKQLAGKVPVAMGPLKQEPGFTGDANGKANANLTRTRSGSYVRSRDVQQPQDSILWTIAYYVVLVAGMIGFYRNLWSRTASSAQLAEI